MQTKKHKICFWWIDSVLEANLSWWLISYKICKIALSMTNYPLNVVVCICVIKYTSQSKYNYEFATVFKKYQTGWTSYTGKENKQIYITWPKFEFPLVFPGHSNLPKHADRWILTSFPSIDSFGSKWPWLGWSTYW